MTRWCATSSCATREPRLHDARGAQCTAALAIVDTGAKFDLLFTDVIMPGGMNGRELADEITRRRPGIKVL